MTSLFNNRQHSKTICLNFHFLIAQAICACPGSLAEAVEFGTGTENGKEGQKPETNIIKCEPDDR